MCVTVCPHHAVHMCMPAHACSCVCMCVHVCPRALTIVSEFMQVSEQVNKMRKWRRMMKRKTCSRGRANRFFTRSTGSGSKWEQAGQCSQNAAIPSLLPLPQQSWHLSPSMNQRTTWANCSARQNVSQHIASGQLSGFGIRTKK